MPLYLMLANSGWIDTYQALIVPSLPNPFAIFIVRQFFLTVPKGLDEAMYVDGGGYWRIFWSLMLPLSGAAISTVLILTFLAEWSTLLKPLVFTTSDATQAPVAGSVLDQPWHPTDAPRSYPARASIVLVSIAPVIIFLALQKRFVESIAATGLKG